jgi:nitrite reductase (NADH) small subunit
VTQVQERQATWVTVCRLDDLLPERGAAAMVDGRQVALVRLVDDTLYAVEQLDPFSGAYVMSRGIVGTATVDGVVVPTLASPMFKQVFDLRTGLCLGDPAAQLGTWAVRELDGLVQVLAPAETTGKPSP